MISFAIIPLMFLFLGFVFFCLVAYLVYRKVKRGVQFTYDKGSKISSEYMNKWRNLEQRKKLPKIVQTGFDDYQIIEKNIEKLPPVWQLKLMPLKNKANSLLNEISHHLVDDETFEGSKFNSVRSFFNHSLDASKQLTQKLVTDHKTLSDNDAERVKDNIQLIYKDILRHERILHKSRKFDFDVVMDVIKARMKS